MTQCYGVILLGLYIFNSFRNTAALECYTCFSDEGFGINQVPGDWDKWKMVHDKTCRTSHSFSFDLECKPEKTNPSFKASCGKLLFVYVNQSSNQKHEITIRGCMATPHEPPEGYCTNLTSLGNLKKLSLFPINFKEDIEYFPDSTCASVCSCKSGDRCRITGGDFVAENNQYTCGGAGGSSGRLPTWLDITLILIWITTRNAIME